MTNPTEITRLRQAMEDFIAARLQSKLEKIERESDKNRLIENELQSFLAKAANLVREGKIQIVTHAIKYSHPDAQGTSLYSRGNPRVGGRLIGTHSIKVGYRADGICNTAANLPYIKFLSLEVDDKPIWQRAVDNDPNLFAALPGDDEEKRTWITAFATLPQPKGGPASHKLAKQLYWPLGNGAYHLLQPLFPSSLVQRVWERLRDDRFSEAAQQARQARRDGKPHPHGYRDWPELVVLKFGSTKPQNISQLNTERHGEAWLLPSRPPAWTSRGITPPRHVESVFERFGRMRLVREHLADLGRFLVGVRDWNNRDIRRGRARRVEAVIDELIQYSGAIRRLPPGWSAKPDCRLPASQRYWLDPERDDPDFQQARAASDWPRQMAESFGAWLNAHLRRYELPVGDAELRSWRREFEDSLHEILQEMEA